MFGVNMRNLISAPKGKKLVVVDLSQIEVRTLCWLSGDRDTMDAIEKSDDIYEAFAIQFGLWSEDKGSLKKEDSKLRHKVKALVLGCGYGAGAKRFAEMYDMTEYEARSAVELYRNKINKVPKFWKKLDRGLKKTYESTSTGRKLVLDLPSGRSLTYPKLSKNLSDGRVKYVTKLNRNGQNRNMTLWGGVLAENLSQALARDIFSFMMLEIDKAGIDIIFHVHDEVICECDEDKAAETLQKITEIMSTPPEWIPDIPLDAEGEILTQYKK